MRFFLALLLCLPGLAVAQDVVTRYSPFMASTAKPFFLTDWPSRVVANGGALPSANSTNSVNIFYTHLVLTGLTNKLISVIGFAPDSLIAATTPIYLQDGYPLWTNVNFGESNLTVNGLQGDTGTKSLLTGLFPATMSAGGFTDISAGISLMIYSATNTDLDFASFEFSGEGSALGTRWGLHQVNSHILYYCWLNTSVNAGYLIRPLPNANSNWSGYISGNRTAADAFRIDMVTNGVFNIYTNNIGTVAGNNNNSITNTRAFASYNPFTQAAAQWSDRTVSFLAAHGGLTFTESSNLMYGTFQLRTNFGGGVPVPQ